MFQKHESIKHGYSFTDARYQNYMLFIADISPDLANIFHMRPPFVNLVPPIKQLTLNGHRAQIVRRYTALTRLDKSQFRRFFETVALAVEFLESKNIYHPELWNRHAVWVHDGNFYICSFTPAKMGSAQRSLKDAFILACNLIYNIGGVTFTELHDFISKPGSDAEPLRDIYDAVANFTGYSRIYSELRRFKPPLRVNLDKEVILAEDPAERLMQQCVLRSVKLI